MTDSRAKGKRGEREAAAAMCEHLGVEARRGQQFAGGADSPDVRHSIPGVHVEVKRVEALNLWKAMEQAKSESRVTDVPVVLSKAEPWVVAPDVEVGGCEGLLRRDGRGVEAGGGA